MHFPITEDLLSWILVTENKEEDKGKDSKYVDNLFLSVLRMFFIIQDIYITSSSPPEVALYQNLTFHCTSTGQIAWTINEVPITTEDQSEYFKAYGTYVPLPSNVSSSSVTVNARVFDDELMLQCHRWEEDEILGSSRIILFRRVRQGQAFS